MLQKIHNSLQTLHFYFHFRLKKLLMVDMVVFILIQKISNGWYFYFHFCTRKFLMIGIVIFFLFKKSDICLYMLCVLLSLLLSTLQVQVFFEDHDDNIELITLGWFWAPHGHAMGFVFLDTWTPSHLLSELMPKNIKF